LRRIGGKRLLPDEVEQAAGDRLDGRERVVDLVAEDPGKSLPGGALLLAERPTHVRENHQLVREPSLSELRATQLPASATACKAAAEGSRSDPAEAGFEFDVARAPPHQPGGGLTEQVLRRAV